MRLVKEGSYESDEHSFAPSSRHKADREGGRMNEVVKGR